jgi:hypothetical protein
MTYVSCDAGGGIGADGDLGGQGAGSKESTVLAAGPFEVAADAAGITWYRGQPGDAGEAFHGVEAGHVAARGGEAATAV